MRKKYLLYIFSFFMLVNTNWRFRVERVLFQEGQKMYLLRELPDNNGVCYDQVVLSYELDAVDDVGQGGTCEPYLGEKIHDMELSVSDVIVVDGCDVVKEEKR